MLGSVLVQLVIAIGLIVLMWAATEAGFRYGLRRQPQGEQFGDFPLGTVEGAMLGLLALLLGFSFAAAGNRFIDRQDRIVSEANAIGTAYLRADLLEAPYRERYRQTLRDYTDARIQMFDDFDAERVAKTRQRSEALHAEMWQAAIEGVRLSPQFDKTVLPPLNEVIDLHTTRLTMANRHIPPLVLSVLILCAAGALGTLGFGCGLRGRRYLMMTFGLSLLLAMTLWLVIDLDFPRRGLIRINQNAMIDLKQSIQPKE